MPVRTPKEVFLMLLSNVRNRTERQSNIYQEIGKHAEEPEIKEAIEARAFASKQILAKLDECFRTHRREAGNIHWTATRNFPRGFPQRSS